MKPRVAILGSGVRWSGARPPAYLEVAGSVADLVGVGLGASVFPYSPAEHVLVEAIHLDAGLRALAERPGAIFIDTFGEYALDALRAATDVPVVGAAEAALVEASGHGPRFAIVTVWPASMTWLYEARLARHHAAAACVGVTYVGPARATGVGVPDAPWDAHESVDRVREQVASGSDALLARVVDDCRTAARRGAHSIVLGCTCMAPMYEELAAALDVPVICASRAGLRRAVELATQVRAADRTPDAALVSRARAAVAGIAAAAATGADAPAGAGITADSGTGCPVCVG